MPRVALERDGAVYDVAALDLAFDTPCSPDRLPGASDFHTRVIALGGLGLAALDERLRAADRPSEARLLPGSFVWLPPCDTDRALYVQMAACDAPFTEPTHALGAARELVGSDVGVPFPEGEGRPDFELGIAAILGEDLRDATEDQAERAILGYAILNTWTGRDEAERRPPGSRRVPAQLGPVLVTADEIGDPARLKAQARVGGRVVEATTLGGATFSIASSIAYVSRWMALRAGDVIGAGGVRGGSGAAVGTQLGYGEVVELSVERLGKLTGKAIRG